MEIIELNFETEDYLEDLMCHLAGQIFHLTSEASFKLIQKEKYIKNNKNGEFQLNVSSDNSFGRKNGWVCLFDFKNKTEEEIQKTISCYTFWGPSWFWEYTEDYKKIALAYLIISPECFDQIVPNSRAPEVFKKTGEYQQYIPKTECWFPGKVPISCVKKVIIVRSCVDAPKNNPFLYAHHLMQCKNRNHA